MRAPPFSGHPLYDRAQRAQCLAQTFQQGVTQQILDDCMAEGLCSAITRAFPKAARIAVLRGGGGNGKQAQALAERYRRTAITAHCFSPNDPGDNESLEDYDVVVDGLIAAGLKGSLSPQYRRLVEKARASGRPIVAIDGPTGLNLETGHAVLGALPATYTYFCGSHKIGALTGFGRELCGRTGLIELPLGWPPSGAQSFVLRESDMAALRPVRPLNAHKGQVGTVAIFGGDEGMPGAVRLAAEGAYRVGGGLVIAGVHVGNAAVLAASFPELIARAADDVQSIFERARWVLVGSGLGRRDWGKRTWEASRLTGKPLVVDGDGLYWLALWPERRGDWILTPHEGEAARLLGISREEVASDRPGACRAIQQRYGGVCVLKGAGTLIADSDNLWLCPRGNAGMAVAGMGDALAGVIAGLAAQGLTASAAACLGVFVHAYAGDRASIAVPYGFSTSDVIGQIPQSLAALC